MRRAARKQRRENLRIPGTGECGVHGPGSLGHSTYSAKKCSTPRSEPKWSDVWTTSLALVDGRTGADLETPVRQ
jgi:hypothetical protein